MLLRQVKSEDDVLHLTNEQLPDFSKRISPMESELLLTYLTAPYVRP